MLFAPNQRSCRPIKRVGTSPTLSFPLIEDRWVLMIGTLSWSLIEYKRTQEREPPSMKPKGERNQEFQGTFSHLKCVSWTPALLLGIVFQPNSNLSVCQSLARYLITAAGALCSKSVGGGDICNCLILTPNIYILEYLSGFLLLVSSDS